MSYVAVWSGRFYYLLKDKTDHRQHRDNLKISQYRLMKIHMQVHMSI